MPGSEDHIADAPMVVPVLRHVMELYGLATYNPMTNGLTFRQEFAAELNQKTPDDLMDHIRKTVQRFAPHAGDADSRLLQYGVFCFYREAKHASQKLDRIFGSRSDLISCCTRWEFAVTGRRDSLRVAESDRMMEVAAMLAVRYGILTATLQLDPGLVQDLPDTADYETGVHDIIRAVRDHVGPEPSNSEVKLMGLVVLTCLPDSVFDSLGPVLTRCIDPGELRQVLESYEDDAGSDPPAP